MLLTLSTAAKGRAQGVFQTDAGKAAGVAPNNFFYTASKLERRATVVRAPALIRPPPGTQGAGRRPFVSTNSMKLPRFAPPLSGVGGQIVAAGPPPATPRRTPLPTSPPRARR